MANNQNQNNNNNNNNSNNNQNKFSWAKLISGIIIVGLLVVILLAMFGVFESHSEFKTWSDFQNNALAWQVNEIETHERDSFISVVTENQGSFNVVAPSSVIEQLNLYILDKSNGLDFSWLSPNDLANVKVVFAKPAEPGFPWLSVILTFLPIILMIVFGFWIFRRMAGANGGILGDQSKSLAKKQRTNKRMSDIAGQEEVKDEINEVIDFLKRPKKYAAAGARVPKGILLAGPPGTGKTLIAKAVATEAGVPFYSMAASQFIEMFAGLGAKRVRDLFKEARKNSPSIIFIDELDAIGRKRGASFSNDEREQTLNQILTEMDGMNEAGLVLVIAATNRPDVLDPALLRPGRFDRQIKVALPNVKERVAILELHAKGKRINKDVKFKDIARRTPAFSGAQLENVINEAALLSVREDTGVITISQIDEAIDRVVSGPAKKLRVITPEENKLVAVHEAGHAVVGVIVVEADIVQKITIIPRGDAGGYNLLTPKKEKYNYKKSELEAKIVSFLGGRAAEQVVYGSGEVSTGASNDIERATYYARAMVTQYGMSKLGPIAYERAVGPQYLGQERQKEYSDALAERIDEAIRDIIITAEQKAIDIIKKNKQLLNLIVEELLDKETIVREEIEYISKHLKRPPQKEEVKVTKDNKKLSDILDKVEKEK